MSEVSGMGNIEHWASIGAAALVKNGVVVDHVTGDVLYDYDFTPIEAARVVLEAVNLQGAVEAIDALLVSLDALNIEAEEGDMAEYDEARAAVESLLRGQ